MLLARALGPADFGAFAAILAIVMIVSPIAGFGVAGYLLRAFGADGWRAMTWVPSCFRFVAISTVSAVAILSIWFGAAHSSASDYHLLPYFLPHLVAIVAIELLIARFQLEERFFLVSIAQMLPALGRLALLFIGLALIDTVDGLVVAAGAYALVGLSICLASIKPLLSFSRGEIELVGHGNSDETQDVTSETRRTTPSIAELLVRLWPFGTTGFLYLVLMQSPIFLTEKLAGAVEAGVFSAAFSLILAIYILPMVIYQRFLLPRLHRWSAHDMTTLRNVYVHGNRIMFIVGTALGIIIWLLAPVMIDLFFGPAYQPSVLVLQWLAICAPLRFLSSSVGAVLVTRDNMRRKVILLGLAACMSVLASIQLIPIWGAHGTAIAVVVGETVLLLTMFLAAQRFVLRTG